MKSPLLAEQTPLVSVIIPTYNAELFIARTLNSVLKQTYQNLEIIIVDDGSNDGTAEIIQQYQQTDARVRLLQQANAGVAAARNLAIGHAKGELIAPLDADDLWHPENIEKQVQCLLQASDDVGLVYAWSIDINEQDMPTGNLRVSNIKGQVYRTLICHYFLGNANACLIRRACFDKVGYYSTHFAQHGIQGCEDWDLCLRIAEFYRFEVVPEFLIGYRQMANSMSRSYQQMADSHAYMLQVARQRIQKVPSFYYRFSSSSFYLYLAAQSSHTGDFPSTFHWLSKAIKVDPVTPLLRINFYALLLISSFKYSRQAVRKQTISLNSLASQDSLKVEQAVGHRSASSLPDFSVRLTAEVSTFPLVPTQRSLRLRLKLLAGDLLHRFTQSRKLTSSH